MSDYTIDDPIYDTFIFETLKLLDEIEESVIESEKKGNFKTYNNKMKRILHTIKGNSMTLELDDISKISHACEDLICTLNNDKIEKSNVIEVADIILEYIDYVRSKLDNLNDNDTNKNKYLNILIKGKDLMKRVNSI